MARNPMFSVSPPDVVTLVRFAILIVEPVATFNQRSAAPLGQQKSFFGEIVYNF
jgi:hypothetical protein